MKKITLIFTLLALSLFIVACGNKDDNDATGNDTVVGEKDGQSTNDTNQTDNGVDDQTDTDGTETDNANKNNSTANGDDDQVAKMERLDYDDFDLSVEYGTDKEYEAELELKPNNIVEAKIEDDLNGVRKKGRAAFDELYPLIEKLTIATDTGKGDVIEQVLTVFNLDADYTEFDLDIHFKDGTKIEYKDMK